MSFEELYHRLMELNSQQPTPFLLNVIECDLCNFYGMKVSEVDE